MSYEEFGRKQYIWTDKRLKAFRSYATCPVRSGRYEKLTEHEREQVEVFILQYGHLDYAAFNVMLRELEKYLAERGVRHLKDAWSLLSEANGVLYTPQRVHRQYQ